MAVIESRGLTRPTGYNIVEHDPTAEASEGFLLGISGSSRSVRVDGFIPMKWVLPEHFDSVATFRMTIVSPPGNVYACEWRQRLVDEFEVDFPRDFAPTATRAVEGEYQLRLYVDGDKAFDATFRLRRDGVIWGHEGEGPVVYSTLQR